MHDALALPRPERRGAGAGAIRAGLVARTIVVMRHLVAAAAEDVVARGIAPLVGAVGRYDPVVEVRDDQGLGQALDQGDDFSGCLPSHHRRGPGGCRA